MRIDRHHFVAICCVAVALAGMVAADVCFAEAGTRPNIILVMTDDQGWGQTGYYGHPVLDTPALDAMAENGLRFDRFYAGAPNCSPTRATVMTGRSNDRTGVFNHGWPLRRQETTVAQALRDAGYATAHFGKWHLNGLRGPGVPILESDPRHPGHFGFDYWLSVTNFFDRDPIMSRMGTFEEFEGDSSEVIVDEALGYIQREKGQGKPLFVVIWYGSPHSPFEASPADKAPFDSLNGASQAHYGELVAMDRSVGALRKGLREMGIAENTLVWFCSDNGGLSGIEPDTVGGLRGFKNSVFEGGLRVPCVVEWPKVIDEPRVTRFPAVTMDIFPTLADVADLPPGVMIEPSDGVSLRRLFDEELGARQKPIPFRHTNRAALIDNDLKLVTLDVGSGEYLLFNVSEDPKETTDLFESRPEVARRLVERFEAWNRSVEASVEGEDYPQGRVTGTDLEPRRWPSTPEYAPYLDQLGQ